MRRKPGREEWMYSWQRPCYFNRRSTREGVHAGLRRLIRTSTWTTSPVSSSGSPTTVLRSCPPPEAFTSYRRGWIESCLRRSTCLADPIFHEARWASRPFFWGPNLFLKPYTLRQRRVTLREHGQLYAIAFDVHEYLLGRAVAKVGKVADGLELCSPGLLLGGGPTVRGSDSGGGR